MQAPRQLKFNQEAKDALKIGVDKVTEAVAATLGPKGNNVAIERPWGAPSVVHDGVTVAKNIELKDRFENLGTQLIIEAAQKTNDVAGDGTTTATVLAQAIIDECLKNIAAGNNAMMLRRGIDQAVKEVVEGLKKMAKPIKSREETTQVATISAQDEEIGKLISEAISKVGRDGVVTVEESGTTGIEMEYKEGMEFAKGFISPYFITDPEAADATVTEPYILITDKKINNMDEFLPFLKMFVETPKQNSNLVIISDGVEGEPLATLILNKMKGKIGIIAVQAPEFGDKRKAVLEDIAIITGSKLITEEAGEKLDSLTIDDLGKAHRVTATKDNTLIVDGRGSRKAIDIRVKALKQLMDKPDIMEFDREKLEERLAKLTSGVAIINVGANTEVEMKEKKERAIDAISATKAALDEGIVPGGEVALVKVVQDLSSKLEDDELAGYNLVKKALLKPFERLLSNAGLSSGEYLRLIRHQDTSGVDVIDGKIKDMVKSGIIDPVKVTRSALQNAASVATMIMTTSVLIVDVVQEPEKDQPLRPHDQAAYNPNTGM